MPWTTKEKKRAYDNRYKREHPEKRWSHAHPDRYRIAERRHHLRKTYGLSMEQFDALLRIQNGRCAACKTTEPGGKGNSWHVDHNHETGFIRGLLCNSCNRACGLLNDNVERLIGLVVYLENPPAHAILLDAERSGPWRSATIAIENT